MLHSHRLLGNFGQQAYDTVEARCSNSSRIKITGTPARFAAQQTIANHHAACEPRRANDKADNAIIWQRNNQATQQTCGPIRFNELETPTASYRIKTAPSSSSHFLTTLSTIPSASSPDKVSVRLCSSIVNSTRLRSLPSAFSLRYVS